MKKIFIAILIVLSSFDAFSKNSNSAKDFAEKAFHEASAHAFNKQVRQSAIKKLKQAISIDPNEPWIYVTESMMTLQAGYKIGKWYQAEAFYPGAVDKALELANKAIEVDSNFSRGYSQLAWIYIIKGDNGRASRCLNTALDLDERNYQAWLYKGTLALVEEDIDAAREGFNEAQKYARHAYEKDILKGRIRDIAQLTGDKEMEEKVLLERIKADPYSAYSYGNYANFLLRNGRYNEAVKYYEKAVSIKPYPVAVERLQRAKALAN